MARIRGRAEYFDFRPQKNKNFQRLQKPIIHHMNMIMSNREIANFTGSTS